MNEDLWAEEVVFPTCRGLPTKTIFSCRFFCTGDFPVHRIAAAKQVSGLENLTNLEALPAAGFTVIALPMKIAGGSGGPVRVIAMLHGN